MRGQARATEIVPLNRETARRVASRALAAAFLTLAPMGSQALEEIPAEVLEGNRSAVEHIRGGAPIRAVWVRGKFGEYGDPVHRVWLDQDGNPLGVEGKFIRLGNRRFRVSREGSSWRIDGKFGDGGSDGFRVERTSDGAVSTIHGRFFHYGDYRFDLRRDAQGLAQGVDGKFGQEGSAGFSFSRDTEGRIVEIRGKFLPFGDDVFRIEYHPGTNLPRVLTGRFARWGDEHFEFFYENW